MCGTCKLSALLILLLATGPAGADEVVLSWDDGSCGDPCEVILGRPGSVGVAMFEAPAWASWLVAMQYYVVTGDEFSVLVMAPSDGAPLLPGSVEYTEIWPASGSSDSRDGWWLEVRLEHPVFIDDEAVFPGRVFFAGAEWMHLFNPRFGWDSIAPVNGRTYYRQPNEEEWLHLDYGDAMIRAVVSDSLSTLVDSASWTAVKAMYR